jgi:hypothetical protein
MRTANTFPTLTEKNELKKTTPPLLSFAKATTSTRLPRATNTNIGEVLPGWVYIRRHNGLIQYKYGPTNSNRYPCAIDQDAKLGRLLFKYRLAIEQYERDNDVLRLGDLSEYYNQPTLQALFAEEDLLILQTESHLTDIVDNDT